jgi:hypothetical protein
LGVGRLVARSAVVVGTRIGTIAGGAVCHGRRANSGSGIESVLVGTVFGVERSLVKGVGLAIVRMVH